MDNNNIVGEMLEKGQGIAANQFKKAIAATQQQIVGKQAGQPAPDASKQVSATDVSQNPIGPGIEQNQSAQKPQSSATTATNPSSQVMGTHPLTPDEQKRINEARERLKLEMHKSNYFNPTFNPPKRQEEPVAEKLEREKQEDLWKKQQEEMKKREQEPLAVSQAKRSTEMNRGTGG